MFSFELILLLEGYLFLCIKIINYSWETCMSATSSCCILLFICIAFTLFFCPTFPLVSVFPANSKCSFCTSPIKALHLFAPPHVACLFEPFASTYQKIAVPTWINLTLSALQAQITRFCNVSKPLKCLSWLGTIPSFVTIWIVQNHRGPSEAFERVLFYR